MPRRIFVERRAYRRAPEEAPVEQTKAEQQSEQQHHQDIQDEVAEIEASSEEVLKHIDEVLALGLGQVSIDAA